MPSDFAKAGKTLEHALRVPDLPIQAIRSASRVQRKQHQWRVAIACALAAIVALGSGTVLAARLFGFRMWLYGNRAASAPVQSFTVYSVPDETTLRHVSSSATFPVVLPVGLPSGTRVLRLVVAPADHPSIIMIQYQNNQAYTLLDSSLVQNGKPPQLPHIVSRPILSLHYWRVGGEVVVSQNSPRWPQDAGIKAAMLRATPQESLAQTISNLYRIVSLDDASDGTGNAADAIAPSDGRTALVDRGHLSEVAALVRDHRALLAAQSTTIDHIPTIQGKRDLGHASFHPGPQKLVVSANGLRAIAAVLATNVCGKAPKFTCELLINERAGMPYRVWVFPVRSPQTPQRYVVDPHSFHAEPATRTASTRRNTMR